MAWLVAIDDPRGDDVRALLERHLEFAHDHTPPEDVHALDLEQLLAPEITFYSLRADGELLGVGALKEHDAEHAEIKSMHTVASARRRGVGRALVAHLLHVAASRGFRRVSLETGAMEAFAPARALYTSFGFVACPPFGDYQESPNSAFMTLVLAP